MVVEWTKILLLVVVLLMVFCSIQGRPMQVAAVCKSVLQGMEHAPCAGGHLKGLIAIILINIVNLAIFGI